MLNSAPALFQHITRDRLTKSYSIIFEDTIALQAARR
jgi:hypothetical protein